MRSIRSDRIGLNAKPGSVLLHVDDVAIVAALLDQPRQCIEESL